MQRVSDRWSQFWPQGGGSFATSARLPASLGHSPFFSLHPPHLFAPTPRLSVRVGLSGLSPAQEASLRPGVPDPGSGTGRPEREESGGTLQSAAEPRGQACMGTVCARRQLHRPGSQFRRGIGHAGASSAAAAGGTVGWGFVGAAQRPAPGWGLGVHWEPGEDGRRARGWVGMDNQHLGRNSSSWFPPSVSEGYSRVPVNRRAGLKGRVCEGEDREAREAVLLAQDTQPRGMGSEGIIKSGKRGWELRGGAWRGGRQDPGPITQA